MGILPNRSVQRFLQPFSLFQSSERHQGIQLWSFRNVKLPSSLSRCYPDAWTVHLENHLGCFLEWSWFKQRIALCQYKNMLSSSTQMSSKKEEECVCGGEPALLLLHYFLLLRWQKGGSMSFVHMCIFVLKEKRRHRWVSCNSCSWLTLWPSSLFPAFLQLLKLCVCVCVFDIWTFSPLGSPIWEGCGPQRDLLRKAQPSVGDNSHDHFMHLQITKVHVL